MANIKLGIAGLFVGFPFDTGNFDVLIESQHALLTFYTHLHLIVKVRFQNPEISQKYHSTLQALTTIIREERFIGLYKGISSPLVSFPCHRIPVPNIVSPNTIPDYHGQAPFILYQATYAFLNGLIFASYRFFIKIQLEKDQAIPTLLQIALAGAGSGIVSSCVAAPFPGILPQW